MLSLIKQEGVVFDAWKLLTLAENQPAEIVTLTVGPLSVPASVWHAHQRELVEREYTHGWPLHLAASELPRFETAHSMKRDLPFDVNGMQLQPALARKVAAAIELLSDIARRSGSAALASSFGAEDMY